MRGVNRVELIGNLGADPDVKYAANGNAVTTLRLATTKKWKDRNTGEMKEETEWHRVTCFKNNALLAKDYLKSGTLVRVDGHIHYDSYEDKHGIKRYTTEVIADQLDWVFDKKSSQKSANSSEIPIDDDIPF